MHLRDLPKLCGGAPEHAGCLCLEDKCDNFYTPRFFSINKAVHCTNGKRMPHVGKAAGVPETNEMYFCSVSFNSGASVMWITTMAGFLGGQLMRDNQSITQETNRITSIKSVTIQKN